MRREGLTEPEFAAAVRDALRHYHRPDRLRDNPLLHSRIVTNASAMAGPSGATRVLKGLIRDACNRLGQVPRDAALRQVLELTYLRPMRNQQLAAEALHLSWSTYRRRLAAAVQLLTAQLWEGEMAVVAVPSDKPRAPARRLLPRTLLGPASAGTLAVLILGGCIWLLLPRDAMPGVAAPALSHRPTLAVLPFDNLSVDPANAYFAAGVQDEILTHLANTGRLRVVEQSAGHPGDDDSLNLKAVAEALHASHVLEGSVQRVGRCVSINVQLIDARSLGHVWARSYTRTLDDVFGVENEVAAKVAAALDAKLNGSQPTRVATLFGERAASAGVVEASGVAPCGIGDVAGSEDAVDNRQQVGARLD